YLLVCDRATGDGAEEASLVAGGIRDVIAGRRRDFYLEYPCHSPTEPRWFSVRISRFEIDGAVRTVVTHDNITQRKLAQLKAQEAYRAMDDELKVVGEIQRS